MKFTQHEFSNNIIITVISNSKEILLVNLIFFKLMSFTFQMSSSAITDENEMR